jgi:hypothetical protein
VKKNEQEIINIIPSRIKQLKIYMYEKRKDETIAPHFSYCKQRKNHNEGHHAPISCCYH